MVQVFWGVEGVYGLAGAGLEGVIAFGQALQGSGEGRILPLFLALARHLTLLSGSREKPNLVCGLKCIAGLRGCQLKYRRATLVSR